MTRQRHISLKDPLLKLPHNRPPAGMLFSRAEQIDLAITGKQASPKVVSKLQDQGVQVILV